MNFSEIDRHSVERVYLITGWKSKTYDYSVQIQLLEECYPNAEIARFSWNSDGSWANALEESDTAAVEKLLETLQLRPSEETGKTALVGHSLGARIAVRTVCRLRRKIHHMTLLGAAIDADDPEVIRATQNVTVGVIHLYNPIDILLHLYKTVEGKSPLGLTKLPFASSKSLSVSTNGLFSKEEGGVFATALPLIAGILGGPAKILMAPLVRFLASTHDCQRYLIYYKNRLEGNEESEFLAEIRELGDDLVGGAANFLSSTTNVGGQIANEWLLEVKESLTLTRDAAQEALHELSESGKNALSAVVSTVKKLF